MGEADLLGWWRSHGMDDVGEYVLAGLFPRTAALAGAEIAIYSAAKRHADALPDRDDIAHLFGEPFPAFAQALALLAELKTGGDRTFLTGLRSWGDPDDAAAGLRALVSTPAPEGERIAGTLRLGSIPASALEDDALVRATAKSLAAAYAGQGRNLTVPYYDLV